MVSLITRIILVVSLFFNAALYYGWMDIGQYRAYIDNLAQDGQEIIESDQFQSLLASVQEKVKELYGEQIEQIQEEVETKVKEVGEEAAVKAIQEKYDKLTEADVKTIVDEVSDSTSGEKTTTKG